MHDLREAKILLKERLARRLPAEGSFATPISGVDLHRRDIVSVPTNCLYTTTIIMVVQGKKRCLVGKDEFVYGENHLFIAGVDMPNTSNILEASPQKPYLAMTVELDRNLMTQLAMEMPAPVPDADASTGLLVQPVSAEILDAFLRLEALFDEPESIHVLAPMIRKELHFRVLTGPGGDRLRLFYTYGSQKNQIARAIVWLRENFRESLAIEDMAEQVYMAPSTFHHRFKEVTGVSPLQFQKRLRLHEAQQLMLLDNLDATSASERVGYESLSQFTREYKRHFGEPPRRDVARWQREHPAP